MRYWFYMSVAILITRAGVVCHRLHGWCAVWGVSLMIRAGINVDQEILDLQKTVRESVVGRSLVRMHKDEI